MGDRPLSCAFLSPNPEGCDAADRPAPALERDPGYFRRARSKRSTEREKGCRCALSGGSKVETISSKENPTRAEWRSSGAALSSIGCAEIRPNLARCALVQQG